MTRICPKIHKQKAHMFVENQNCAAKIISRHPKLLRSVFPWWGFVFWTGLGQVILSSFGYALQIRQNLSRTSILPDFDRSASFCLEKPKNNIKIMQEPQFPYNQKFCWKCSKRESQQLILVNPFVGPLFCLRFVTTSPDCFGMRFGPLLCREAAIAWHCADGSCGMH